MSAPCASGRARQWVNDISSSKRSLRSIDEHCRPLRQANAVVNGHAAIVQSTQVIDIRYIFDHDIDAAAPALRTQLAQRVKEIAGQGPPQIHGNGRRVVKLGIENSLAPRADASGTDRFGVIGSA
jgi:hypothetical protein